MIESLILLMKWDMHSRYQLISVHSIAVSLLHNRMMVRRTVSSGVFSRNVPQSYITDHPEMCPACFTLWFVVRIITELVPRRLSCKTGGEVVRCGFSWICTCHRPFSSDPRIRPGNDWLWSDASCTHIRKHELGGSVSMGPHHYSRKPTGLPDRFGKRCRFRLCSNKCTLPASDVLDVWTWHSNLPAISLWKLLLCVVLQLVPVRASG
jgi:hypothetical protein